MRPAAKPRPVRRSTRANNRRWLFTVIIGLIAILVNIPLLNAILVSFKPDGEIAKNPLALPSNPTLSHYANVLYASGYDFPRFFANSAMIALGTVVLVLLIAVPATYAIVRLRFGGRWIIDSASGLRLLRQQRRDGRKIAGIALATGDKGARAILLAGRQNH